MTLKLSAVENEIEFDLEASKGELDELKVVEFTIEDLLKVVRLQMPVFNGEAEKLLSPEEINKLMVSRVVCAVKCRKTNAYYWDIEDINDFDFNKYPKNLLESIADLVNKVNPIVTDLEGEKKSS